MPRLTMTCLLLGSAPLILLGGASAAAGESTVHVSIADYGAVPNGDALQTTAIQNAIDACHAAGGGIVRVPKGVFVTGGIQLRSGIEIHLEDGAVLRGSEDCADYGGGSRWDDALIKGKNLYDVAITGPGTLDGADCRNPNGEEGFRGPHGVWLEHCQTIRISGITVTRSANWAFHILDSKDAVFEGVSVRGGHDGIHAQRSTGFRVKDCDFRTGDDCVAGQGNSDFVFSNCRFNTSCNGFRFSCVGLRVADCRFWGPGEAEHKISGRHNMLTAFVHFSPRDRGCGGPEPDSDDWLVEDCTVENVDRFYAYDYQEGLWQKGQPVAKVVIRNVTVRGALHPIVVLGDGGRQFDLTLEDVDLALRAEAAPGPLVTVREFDRVDLNRVTLGGSSDGGQALLRIQDGNRVRIADVTIPAGTRAKHDIGGVDTVEMLPRAE